MADLEHVKFTATSRNTAGLEYSLAGHLTVDLSSDGKVVRGTVDDDEVVSGKLTETTLEVETLSNGSIHFKYKLSLEDGTGSFTSDRPAGDDFCEGKIANVVVERTSGKSVDTLPPEYGEDAIPSAVDLKLERELEVPCATCDSPLGKLSFFSLAIPHFGSCELCAFSCSKCGYKYNELRPADVSRRAEAAQASGEGQLIICRIESPRDLKRHAVLSDHAQTTVPELDLSYVATGRYSTLEGIVAACLPSPQKVSLFQDGGDLETSSGKGEGEGAWATARAKLDALLARGKGFVVEIRDPTGRSFVSGAMDEAVKHITQESYKLSEEEKEAMGVPSGYGEVGDGVEEDGATAPSSSASSSSSSSSSAAAAAAATAATDMSTKVDPRQEEENRKMMKHLNAIAAEFTKEYDGRGERRADEDCVEEDEDVVDYEGMD